MPLRIGRIAYLNVAPYFQYLSSCGFNGEVVSGVPSELNAMLASGSIDACPSSSFEYGQNAESYYLLPGHSISSVGPVHSVLLFTPGPISALSGGEIAITGESATSINLLKILLLEFCGIDDFSFHVPQNPVEESLNSGQSALLIGDRALAAAVNCPEGFQT
ncbi:MAG: menaquinone biosynthesis protein, partial [Gammaproteobacteria bacterium]|nr:menaquinone biosynthesis protein [Gammaproteobacteria bacterium]NIR94217.1 menaquinone biosynthesis protein [Gammaproteobacteria bacterium]NIW49911.1 futalosine synthase [Gammaproteobacteria bacterium]NIX59321.1 futalosine synthase [candidate division Zixibacteria bacterium]